MKTIVRWILCGFVFCPIIWSQEPAFSWVPNGGVAPKAPELTENDSGPDGTKAIKAVAAADGDWQGITVKFDPPLDLSKYLGLEFYIRQDFLKAGKNHFALNMYYVGGQQVFRNVICGKPGQWHKVSAPFDPAAWETGKALKVQFKEVTNISIYPFRNMNKAGYSMEISDFRLIPKETQEVSRELAIMQYSYRGQKGAGDADCIRLRDGNLEESVVWPAYSDDPNIVFDLGGIQTVDRIKINAFSSAIHNFTGLVVLYSLDGENWIQGASIKNPGEDNTIKLLEFNCTGQKLTGRYFRVQATRERTDFPISFSEITFFGSLATEAEKKTSSMANYDNGHTMPEPDTENYYRLNNDQWELWVHKSTGIINGVFFRGKRILERLNNRYLLQSRKEDIPSDAYADQVISAQQKNASLTFTVRNPGLPGLELEKCYTLEKDAFAEKLTVHNTGMTERLFLQVYTEVILNRDFRKNGFYETLGYGHSLRRWHASEILLETAAGSVPTLFFENHESKQTILHTRTHFNDQFTYFDYSENTSSGVCANGWFICGMSVVPMDQRDQSCVNRFSISKGNLFNAYCDYIELPEASAYRQQIQRPAWLRDVIVIASGGGWDMICRNVGTRYTGNLLRMFKRGYLPIPAASHIDSCWGEWPSEGLIRDEFGGIRSAEQIKEELASIKAMSPRLKIGLYTWLWSAFPWSKPAKEHPDWFVKHLRSGAPASWFPNLSVNWQQFIGIPESREAVFQEIAKLTRFYDCDIWYLDGGGVGRFARDWDTMRIDDLFGWSKLYLDMRQELHRQSPDKIFFTNTPCNPLGDMGYLESFSGALTSDWRIGAAWMFQFKMFQHRDPLHHPLYIYWLPGIDGPFQNYMLGTGLLPTLNSHSLNSADIPYISARYEVRNLSMVNANVAPDWRKDTQCELECMTLKQGRGGFVFMQEHGSAKKEKVAVDARALGIDATEKPVYHWSFRIKNGRNKFARFGEPQLAKAYKASGWISERALVPHFLGKTAWQERFEQTFDLQAGEGLVWMMTQVPAFIRSVEDIPAHFRLPDQAGILFEGDLEKLQVDSEFDCEVALLLPEGKIAASVIVNDQARTPRVLCEHNLRFAAVSLKKGKSLISVQLTDEPMQKPVQLHVEIKGRQLSISGVPDIVPVSVYSNQELCLAANGSFSILLPDIVPDGEYLVKAGEQTAHFTVKGLAKALWLEPLLKPLPVTGEIKEAPGELTINSATAFNQDTSFALADAQNLLLEAGTTPVYDSFFNISAAAFELKVKRFVKVKYINGMKYHNQYGLRSKHHFPRYDRVDCYAGLILDFNTDKGYSVRSAAGMGKQNIKRQSPAPKWGKNAKPDHLFILNNAIHEDKLEFWTTWLDLNSLGAPADWNGKIWFTLLLQNLAPDRRFSIQILETADALPEGEKAENVLTLGAQVSRKVFELKQSNPETMQKEPPLAQLVLSNEKDMSPSYVRVAYDETNLYLHFDFFEPEKKIPDCDFGKVWFNDSIEFNIQLADHPEDALHVVINNNGKFYAEINKLKRTAGSKTTQLNELPADFTADVQPERWRFLVTLPLSKLGIQGKPAEGLKLGFNLMRNRAVTGKMQLYSLVPRQWFSGDIYQMEF